jgi:hypothetical protein
VTAVSAAIAGEGTTLRAEDGSAADLGP